MRIKFKSKIVKPNVIKVPKRILYGTVLKDYMEKGEYVTVEIVVDEEGDN